MFRAESALWGGVALLLSLALCRGAISFGARSTRFTDLPNGTLKPHSTPVPRSGGMAFGAAFFGTALATSILSPVGATLLSVLWVVGIRDDLKSMQPSVRLAIQLFAGALLLPLAAGAQLSLPIGMAGALLLVGAVNGVNWIDGRNGLATTTLLAISLPTAVWGEGESARTALLLSTALLGFLPWNLKGKIFMGDGGSYLLGGAVSFWAAAEWGISRNPGPALGLLPLALDALQVVITRLRNKRSPFAGDRSHLYDRLIDRGWPLSKVIFLYSGTTLLLATAGSLFWRG